MKRMMLTLVLCAGIAGLDVPVAKAAAFSDEAVGNAIKKGVAYIWSRQRADGSWPDAAGGLHIRDNDRIIGTTSLMTYALLASGVKIENEPRIVKALTWLGQQKTGWTYAVSLRSQAWMEAAKQDPKYKRQLYADAKALWLAAGRGPKPAGSYGYRLDYNLDKEKRRQPLNDHDASNGQYGVLGVWAAYQLDCEVPNGFWKVVMNFWARNQQRDGGWKYKDGDKHSSGTMTTAGLATMFVCVDAALGGKFVRCQRSEDIVFLKKGLQWFDKNFEATLRDDQLCHGGHGDRYYYLFGVERVGLASGYKYFGKADWYRLGATWLLGQQNARGFWQGNWGRDVATAYSLLFLSRGRRAVLFNRLEYEGDWNNRPRALANLCRWAYNAFEQDVYWQIVNFRGGVSQLHDAPILVISGSEEPKFTDEQIAYLRRYVWQGGTIFSIAECSGKAFQDGIRQVYAKAFPTRTLKLLPRQHPLYSLQGQTPAGLKFYEIGNGGRPFVIHTDTDLCLPFQCNRKASAKESFQAAGNVAMYVTGKQLRNRGVSQWPAAPQRASGPTVRLARVKHSGDYDPEPLAWQRVARLLPAGAKVNLEVVGPLDIGELKSSGAKVAALTGTGELKLSDAEKKALEAFVNGGGLLVVDAAGGVAGAGAAFAESAEIALREIFGRRSLRTLSTEADLFRLKGYPIDKVHYRQKTRIRLGKSTESRLKGVMLGGRIGVIFSREDLTIALIGSSAVGCDGYTPASAYAIARNIILYAAGTKRGGK